MPEEHTEAEWRDLYDTFNNWLTDSVGISKTLLQSLKTDDDWTFVIKMHGILEAGLNHLLMVRLDDSRLSEVVSKMETNNSRTGKMAFVKAYDLLPDDSCSFVQVLSKIRNDAVHDIKNFDLNLVEYFKTFSSKKLKDWKTALASGLPPITNVDGIERASRDTVLENPRYAIFTGCMAIMFRILQRQTMAEGDRKVMDAMRSLGEFVYQQELDALRSRSIPKKPE
ncbi:MAG: hypothetical protein QOG67_1896 [Verrucomicrobiota bacterium]|jgi:hypothetical protein